MKPTVVVYGNCQARVVAIEIADALEPGYAVRFQESHRLNRPSPPVPSDAELAACVLLVEQVGEQPYARAGDLPLGCPVVRFPSLDTNLLWPFSAVNPFDLPDPPAIEGPYPYGDRILQRCIERGWSPERILAYYFERYDEFRLDMSRVAVLERARRDARDRRSDVKMADALEDQISAPTFYNKNHPRPELIRILLARLATACEPHVPALAALRDARAEAWSWPEVPIHPGVAADLGLTWSDPAAALAYARDFVASAIANRARQHADGTAGFADEHAFRPPFSGPARIVGPVVGIYPDGFAAPALRFEFEALEPLEEIAVDAYYPPQHRAAAAVVCTLGASNAEVMVEPGSPFTLSLPAPIAPGERARFALSCSQTLNLFERGEDQDDRDLGVLVLEIRCR